MSKVDSPSGQDLRSRTRIGLRAHEAYAVIETDMLLEDDPNGYVRYQQNLMQRVLRATGARVANDPYSTDALQPQGAMRIELWHKDGWLHLRRRPVEAPFGHFLYVPPLIEDA
jgi:hypothetical protein